MLRVFLISFAVSFATLVASCQSGSFNTQSASTISNQGLDQLADDKTSQQQDIIESNQDDELKTSHSVLASDVGNTVPLAVNNSVLNSENNAIDWLLPATMDASPAPTTLEFSPASSFYSFDYSHLDQYIRRHKKGHDYARAFFFKQHAEERLTDLLPIFHEVSLQTGLDWKLLAAISYQESHWDPKAISPTGVKGLMMLTAQTALEMGVPDRTDIKQSIRGGARYYQKIYARLPKNIREPDRTLMALASYNAGYGHVLDARTLTQQQGGDYRKWADVKRRLPMLQDPNIYVDSRHGYSSGARQALAYVHSIQEFYELIVIASRMPVQTVADNQIMISSHQQIALN